MNTKSTSYLITSNSNQLNLSELADLEWQERNAYVWAVLSDGSAEGLDDAGVDVEEVVPSHAGLPRHPSRDDHDVRPL
jgi:hypothetical protein